MIKYKWAITYDFTGNGDSGKESPDYHDYEAYDNESKFAMYDNNYELLYTGIIFGEYSGLEPLNDFGYNKGCNKITINSKEL